MRMDVRAGVLALAAGLALGAGQAQAQFEIIYTGVATAPAAKREVPGYPALGFDTFYNMFASPNGQYWAARISTNDVTTNDDVIVFGSGTTAVVVAKEGDATPFDATRTWGLFDSEIGINDSGAILFVNNLAGTVTTDDEVMVRYILNAGVPTFDDIMYREGQPVPDAGLTPFIPAGATVGINISDPWLLEDGRPCAIIQLAPLTGEITTSDDECVYVGKTATQRELKTSPNNSTALWDFFSSARYTPDGLTSLIDGDDNTLSDDITALNNDIVIQQGQTIAGLTTPTDSGASDFAWITPNGDWYAVGSNTNADEDWVLRNGVVIANALSGPTQDITPANPSGELWDDTDYSDCFFLVFANSTGDYIIGGVTNAANSFADAVLVLNGTTVLAREGDPIDLDGNGLFDDNTFIRTFGDDSGFLTDDGWLYVRMSLTDNQALGATGPDLGSAFVRMKINTGPAPCYANCDGSTGSPVLNTADFGCFLSKFAAGDPYANCDGSTGNPTLNVADFGCFLAKFAAGCQ